MRRILRSSLALISLAVLGPSARAEDVVRTIRAELAVDSVAGFSIENLVGTMRIREAAVATVTVVATVHAESQSLADGVSWERITGGDAVALRVRYPYDQVGTFRYREPGSEGYWERFNSSSRHQYDGRGVQVNGSRGTRLYADVEVQIPAGETNGRFVNLVGLVDAEGLRGRLRFEVASADLRLASLEGTLEVEGSSGDIRARDLKGSWKSTSSSGDIKLEGFDGDVLELHANSGDFRVDSVKARRIVTETNSGDVRFLNTDVEEFIAEATSGDIELAGTGSRLKTVDVSTNSGDVTLRLPRDASFEATARQSSGDMRVGFSDGTSVQKDDAVVAYRRGDHGARIRVRTSSGDFSLAPI